MFFQCCQPVKCCSPDKSGEALTLSADDVDSRGKLVTPRHSCNIHQRRVIAWPAATCLHSHCQCNLLKRNEGLGIILAPDGTNNVIRPYYKYWCYYMSHKVGSTSLIPPCFMFLQSSILAGQCLLFLLTVLISWYWLSLAYEQSCFRECSVNSHVRSFMWKKRSANTLCTQSCHLK